MNRIIQTMAVVLLMVSAKYGTGQAAGLDEAKLKSQFEGKIISLHGFYAQQFQKFNVDGDAKEKYEVCPWTICSKLEVSKISISKNKLKVEGSRIWVLFKEGPREVSYARSPEYMQVEIDLADGPEQSKRFAAAFPKVFLAGNQRFEDDLPEFWKLAFERSMGNPPVAKTEVKEESSAPKKDETASTPAAPKKATKRVRVPQGVTEGMLVKKVTPQYPRTALWTKISGMVVMHALIDKNGDIAELHLIKPVGAGLDEAAVDGVKQWKYKPYLLNGEPVEVDTQITINFKL